jgi:hypothetical protein
MRPLKLRDIFLQNSSVSGKQMTERRSQRGSISEAAISTGMSHSHMFRKAEAVWCASSVGRFVANDK